MPKTYYPLNIGGNEILLRADDANPRLSISRKFYEKRAELFDADVEMELKAFDLLAESIPEGKFSVKLKTKAGREFVASRVISEEGEENIVVFEADKADEVVDIS